MTLMLGVDCICMFQLEMESGRRKFQMEREVLKSRLEEEKKNLKVRKHFYIFTASIAVYKFKSCCCCCCC